MRKISPLLMKKSRLFVDIILPVVLYSVILLVAQLVIMIAMTVVYYAAHTGEDALVIAEKAEEFLLDNAMLISLLGNIFTFVVIFIDSKIRKVRISDYTQLSKPIGLRGGISAVLCGMSFSMWLSIMLSLLPIPESWMNDYADASASLNETSLIAVIATAVAAPIIEEMLFRGIIYRHLCICLPEYLSLVIQAVIFAVLHGDTIIWVSYALLGGLLFGYIRMLTGSIRATILAHMTFNLIGYVVEFLGQGLVTFLIMVSPIVLIFSVRDMYKQSIKSE